ncbi:MAG TPA: triphosphoribosyl-dephospho-CoA synthase [Thermoanaerobaculia bacterium]|nr:triphosphoribosyl-dephospho-CoA synthase [Thermoanaerobaculia bacterium]
MDIRREILRNVILCQALEPLAQKPGLLSRQDGAAGAKLELFIVAGVNSSWPFYDLADRILRHGGQPDCLYDLAYEALSASGRNRLGGTVNYGQILLLIPLVTAQVLEYLDKGTYENVEALLARTGDVLHNTTEKDVEYVEKFIQLGYELSARQRERTGSAPKASGPAVLQGKYANVWEAARDRQQIYIVREFFQGYPNCLQVYRYLLHNLDEGLLHGSEMMYRVLLTEIQRADAVVDIIVAGLYLVLTSHPESVLFP